jgi:hypothetical protein
MVSNRFTTYIIIFNLLFGLLLFFSSQIILVVLNNQVVQKVGIFIEYNSSYSGPIQDTPTGISAPLLNYPLVVLIFGLAINAFFLIKLRGKTKKVLTTIN